MTAQCPECGRLAPFWTPGRIIEAAQVWTERYGVAPRWSDWNRASYENPTNHTVRSRFGSWRNMLAKAGLTPVVQEWTVEDVTQALFEWRYQHGRLPEPGDWRKNAPGRPTYFTVRNLFGSWGRMLEECGYEKPGARPGRDG